MKQLKTILFASPNKRLRIIVRAMFKLETASKPERIEARRFIVRAIDLGGEGGSEFHRGEERNEIELIEYPYNATYSRTTSVQRALIYWTRSEMMKLDACKYILYVDPTISNAISNQEIY